MTAAVAEPEIDPRFPYRREIPNLSLADLRAQVVVPSQSIQVSASEIDLGGMTGETPSIALGTREVRLDERGLESLTNILDVPTQFFMRQNKENRQTLFQMLLAASPGAISFDVSDEDTILAAREPNLKIIEPERLVDAASTVFGESSQVVSYFNKPAEFGFDVIVPAGADRGIGGDRRVNDITRGGARFFLDRKHNLSPTVNTFLHRLVCTNGMEVRDEGLKIDSRGQSVDEVLAELERMAERAFSAVESSIEHFYAMREERVSNPDRELDRMLREQNVPDRTIQTMVRALPAMLPGEEVTRFDLVNHITHHANVSGLRAGVARNLQRSGGEIVTAHALRCDNCHSRLDR